MSFENPTNHTMQSILKEFECPVCVDYMVPPIRMCVEGHNFCHRCHEKLKKCPICRGEKNGLRNYGMENIFHKLTFPCRNLSKGCPIQILGANLKEHQKFCQYNTKRCPLIAIHNCQWTGPVKDMFAHCMQKHSTNAYCTSKMHFMHPRIQNGNILTSAQPGDCYHMVFDAYEELFKFVWEFNMDDGLMRWCLIYMGPKINASKYYFEIVFQNVENSNSEETAIRCRSPCCILMHIDMVRKLSGTCGLFYTIYIRKCNEEAQLPSSVSIEPFDSETDNSEVLNNFIIPQPIART